MSSGKCSVANCNHLAHILCHGCQSNFCRKHLIEHSASIHMQLNPLINQVNELDADFRQLNRQNLLQNFHKKLEEWRKQAHEIVEKYFRVKMNEVNTYIQKHLQQFETDLHDIQQNIIFHKRERETTHEQIHSLTYQIEDIKKNYIKIKLNDMDIQINTLPIARDLINCERLLNVAALPPIYRVIDRVEEKYSLLATNKELLLLHRDDALVVVDKDLKIYRKTPWTYGPIFDMCYSAALDRFIIINEHEVFLFNEGNMNIEKVRSIPWQRWSSCTCSDLSLYLTTRVYTSSLLQFCLTPKIEFMRKWPPSLVCKNDEYIDGIVYNNNNNTLALMITNNQEQNIRLELKSTVTFGKIWSLSLDIAYAQNHAFRFCLINSKEWVVVDYKDSRLLYITKDGKMKTTTIYQSQPCCAIEFGNDILAISTRTVVNLHKF